MQLPVWKQLAQHAQHIAPFSITDLMPDKLQSDAQHIIEFEQLLFDYSKNRLTSETISLLIQLAKQRELPKHIQRLFAGECVNESEKRPAMHMDCRRANPQHHAVQESLQQIQILADQFDPEITDIIHIGIGGSDFGPAMLNAVFSQQLMSRVRCHFISAYEVNALQRCLQTLHPKTTAVVVVSKSFTTRETLLNADAIRQWQRQAHVLSSHWYAVTENPAIAHAFGIALSHILPMWSWVGGRYSLWSAVSFSIVLTYGFSPFMELLAGAAAMDAHFETASLSQNIPVILALIDIWYQHFFQINNRVIIAYQQSLQLLPQYCQQLHMESLGKSVTQSGNPVTAHTGQIIWGGIGTNSQHTFHQLLMQGTHCIPVDFILPLRAHDQAPLEEEAISHCLAQSKTLMQGYSAAEIRADLQQQGVDTAEIERMVNHKIIKGNQPSNLLLLMTLSPYNLGVLLAMYEHKVYVQSVMWNINAFDQPGIDAAKQMLTTYSDFM